MIVIAKMLLIQQSVSTTSALGEGRGHFGLDFNDNNINLHKCEFSTQTEIIHRFLTYLP